MASLLGKCTNADVGHTNEAEISVNLTPHIVMF
jgi:hypothetical protein